MLVDRFGNELKSNKPIVEEIAIQTIRERYTTYPSQGLTPQRLAHIFKEADQGDIFRQAELFHEMEEKDLHLGAVLQSRRLAVAGLDWDVLPASESAEDVKIATAAKEMLEYIENWEDAVLDMMDAIGKAFSVEEIMWEISEGQVWIETLEWINQRRFTFNSPTVLLKEPRLITDDEPVWGEELIPNKFVVHKSKARSGATQRGGLLRPCAYMFLFKNFDLKDWLVFNELFSVPMRVGKYKPGTPPKEIDVLKRAVFNLGVDAAAVVSDTTVIELVESKLRGDVSSFEKFLEVCDRAMSKAVLGHTGSADGTPGRLGNDDQAGQLRQDLLEADAKAVMKTVKFQIIAPWVEYNFGPGKGVPKFVLHYEAEEDLKNTAEIYGIIVEKMGFREIGVKHIQERFGIPEPAKGELTLADLAPQVPVIENPSQIPLNPPLPKGEVKKNKGIIMVNKGPDKKETDWVAKYMKRLAPEMSSARTALIDEVTTWINSLESPPTETEFIANVQNILGAGYAKLDAKTITETISDMYLEYRAAPGVATNFGGPDIRAINFLSSLDEFYVSKFITNSDAQKTVTDFLSQRYLEQGANLFKRGSAEDINAFRDLFAQKLTDLEDYQVRRIVDTSVQRTRNWASIAQMNEGGISEVEIYEPTQDCEFCTKMNGQKISVGTAYAKMTEQAGMTPGEYEQDLKAVQPVDANIEAMIGEGRLPPYHAHCHGTVLRTASK